jgi:uncharacterized protein (TIGR02118 family)
MVKLVLLFKHPENPHTFDLRYERNLALLKKMPHVKSIQEGNVIGSPAGHTSFYRVLEVLFENFTDLDAALTAPEGVAAGKDLMDYAGKIVELLFVEAPEPERTRITPLTPDHLQAHLNENNITAEIIYPGSPTPTVAAAAKALNVEPDQIVKSVVFLVEDKPFLIYGCGTRLVDARKLADRLNVNRKQVRLANATQVLDITGYAVGTVPPIGLKTPMPVFMDPSVQNHETIYAGGGGNNALLKISSADLLRVSKAEIVPMLHDNTAKKTEPDVD